jgi:hypothetical protein
MDVILTSDPSLAVSRNGLPGWTTRPVVGIVVVESDKDDGRRSVAADDATMLHCRFRCFGFRDDGYISIDGDIMNASTMKDLLSMTLHQHQQKQ